MSRGIAGDGVSRARRTPPRRLRLRRGGRGDAQEAHGGVSREEDAAAESPKKARPAEPREAVKGRGGGEEVERVEEDARRATRPGRSHRTGLRLRGAPRQAPSKGSQGTPGCHGCWVGNRSDGCLNEVASGLKFKPGACHVPCHQAGAPVRLPGVPPKRQQRHVSLLGINARL